MNDTWQVLVSRVESLAQDRARVLLGIVGAPGVGKSTFASNLARQLNGAAAIAPMDGFHLANQELERMERRHRKGAVDTFDAHGFACAVERLARAQEEITYLPSFERNIEEPIAGAIPIFNDVPIVIVEGNYLLLDEAPWDRVARVLTEVWYLDLPDLIRLEQLQDRHIHFGDDPTTARERALGSDEVNARLIQETKERADHVVSLTALR